MKQEKLAIILGLLALASCREDIQQPSLQIRQAMVITRTDANVGNGCTMGMFLTDSEGKDYNGQDYGNVLWTYSSSKWTSESPVLLSSTQGRVRFYSPYSTEAEAGSFPLMAGTDHMYSEWNEDISNGSPAVTLTLRRVMLRVALSVDATEYDKDGWLTQVALESHGYGYSQGICTFSTDGGFSPEGTTSFQEETDLCLKEDTENEGITFLLVPAESDYGSMTLTLTVDQKDYKAELPAASTDLAAGESWNYSLRLKGGEGGGLMVKETTVEDWTVSDQGTQDIYPS